MEPLDMEKQRGVEKTSKEGSGYGVGSAWDDILYEKKLTEMVLTTLEERRYQADLLQIYTILTSQ
jgi:hypothetical protein